MKIYLTLFCLICGGALAGASTNTAADVQDKPVRLYVTSDTLSTDTNLLDVGIDNAGGWDDEYVSYQYDYQWQDGGGGNGSAQFVQQSDDGDSDGFLWGATNGISSVMTWTANGSGTEIDTYYAGSIFTNAIGLPLLTSEHCVVNDSQTPPPRFVDDGDGNWASYQDYEEYVRYSQTRWRLQTGGRAGGSGLFQLSATATQILDKRAQRPFYNVNSQAVPPQNITVLGQAQYPDANLWIALPNGTNLDVTPFVAGSDFYTMNVTEQKYKLYVLVNTTAPLASDRVVPWANYCVGEYMNFAGMWTPGLPPGISSQAVQWDFDGDYVNDHTNAVPGGSPPSSSENYFLNTNLLSLATTTNWWVSGDTNWPGAQYSASLTENLVFTNGQTAQISRSGLFEMYRPSLLGWTQDVQVIVTNYTGIPFVSEVVGVGTADGANGMTFRTYISSAYAGVAGFTQVFDDQSYPTDYGSNVLDGAEMYTHQGPINVGTNNWVQNSLQYSDKPSEESTYGGSFIALVLQFRDYVRFMPTIGGPNIYVTLGKATWNVNATATNTNGTWVLNPGSPVVPSWGPSQEFPYWLTVGSGH